ncbi:MAG: DegT/DnrJ/EryC1/StrS aminotransferase family protein [Deltaproteobacteria bacterium]|nr:DegT/DnrJ/EryC1/StrS aminotransferase family protein [Deltaproteobacteria bacterium]
MSEIKNQKIDSEKKRPRRIQSVKRAQALFAPWPHFDQDEITAVVRVLESGKVNYWTGEEGRLFERRFASAFDCDYAVALANGTVALELALHALGIAPGAEVVTTSRTFIASASAIVMRGCVPVMADVDPVSQNMTAETLKAVVTPRTRAVIAVHLAGWPCDMDPILEVAGEHGLKVIEDCAQAHGAKYKGRPVGSIGDAAAFSFCQDKIMTTAGEGGMLTTNTREVWERAWAFKDHGKSYRAVHDTSPSPGFRWLHETFGTNWRMTEMQAAVGMSVLKKLPGWVELRRRNAAILTASFKQAAGLRITEPPPDFFHSYYKYYAFVEPERLKPGWSRDRIMNEITGQGVPCFSGSCSEIYQEKAFGTLGKRGKGPQNRLPVARQLGETSLMFLVHPTLSEEALEKTARTVKEVFGRAVR